jgi:hypothetical protein
LEFAVTIWLQTWQRNQHVRVASMVMAVHKEATFAARIRGRGTSPAWNTTLVGDYADKLAFKAYAAAKGVDTVRTLWATDNWEGLRPENVPSDCLLKDAGGSGRTLLIRNHRVVSAKSTPELKGLHIHHDWERVRRASLQFWAHSRSHTKGEPWYQHIRPRFFVEELLSPLPTDFKVHITHGIVRSIMVVTGRNGPGPTRYASYSEEWVRDKCLYAYTEAQRRNRATLNDSSSTFGVPRPAQLAQIVQHAKRLAGGFAFARVDMFEHRGRVLAGEITFAPFAGKIEFIDTSCDMAWTSGWSSDPIPSWSFRARVRQAYSDWQYTDWWAVVRRQPLSQFGYCVTVPCARALSDATRERLATAACIAGAGVVLVLLIMLLQRFAIARRWRHARPQSDKAPNAWVWACVTPSGPACISCEGGAHSQPRQSEQAFLRWDQDERAPLLGGFTRALHVI